MGLTMRTCILLYNTIVEYKCHDDDYSYVPYYEKWEGNIEVEYEFNGLRQAHMPYCDSAVHASLKHDLNVDI